MPKAIEVEMKMMTMMRLNLSHLERNVLYLEKILCLGVERCHQVEDIGNLEKGFRVIVESVRRYSRCESY